MGKNVLYLGIGVVVLILAGVLIFLATSPKSAELPQTQQAAPIKEESEALGSELNQNPGSEVPETNPFGEAQTNPFQGYKNPFD